MSKYLLAFEEFMRNGKKRALEEKDPHRRAILLNYNRHAALEFSDNWHHIFTKAMSVDEPYYRVHLGNPPSKESIPPWTNAVSGCRTNSCSSMTGAWRPIRHSDNSQQGPRS